jgi:death-on-curing protein
LNLPHGSPVDIARLSPNLPKADDYSAPSERRPLVEIEELVWLHTVSIGEFGGGEGIRDSGLLESALARPYSGFGGHYLFDGACLRAAALAEALIQNHGFVDGNKRVAMYAMGLWLEREGLRLETSQEELIEYALGLATRQLGAAEAATWLEERTVKLN